MYLVLAIILGGYLLLRCSCEKAETKAIRSEHDRKFSEWSARHDAFIAAYRDDELEHAVKMSRQMQDEAAALIRGNTPIIRPTYLMIKMVAMAMRGKIPSECLESSIGSRCDGDVIEQRQQREALVSFLEWYNTILKSHGVQEDMMSYITDKSSQLQLLIPHDLSLAHTEQWACITWPSVKHYWENSGIGLHAIHKDCIDIR